MTTFDPTLTTVPIRIDDTDGEMTLRCGQDGDGEAKDFPTYNCEELTLTFRDHHELAEQIKSWIDDFTGDESYALDHAIELACERMFTDAIEQAAKLRRGE